MAGYRRLFENVLGSARVLHQEAAVTSPTRRFCLGNSVGDLILWQLTSRLFLWLV